MLGFSHLLEIVEIQPSQLHKLHNRAKHIPGQFENRKSLRVRNPTQSAAAAKVDKSVERLMFTRFSKENGSNGGGNFFVFLFCRKIACTNESSHTSHWNRCRKSPPVNKGRSKILQANLIKRCNNINYGPKIAENSPYWGKFLGFREARILRIKVSRRSNHNTNQLIGCTNWGRLGQIILTRFLSIRISGKIKFNFLFFEKSH